MKLTHRDFRPLRRSKYVAQPLKRRPTLRILALAAIGIAVYLKFDSVVNSKVFQNFRQPRRLVDAMLHQPPADSAVASAAGLAWSPDSTRLDAECMDSTVENCLKRWQSVLGSEATGALRGILAKASTQLEVEAAHGFEARFVPIVESSDPLEGPPASLELTRLEIRGGKESLVLERTPGNALAPFCGKQGCLDVNPARMPFARYRITETTDSAYPEPNRTPGPMLSLVPLSGLKAKPIQRGRVVEVPAAMEAHQWVKIYHGANLFSFYRGLASLDPAVKTGAMIESGEFLGQVAAIGDSAGVLDLRIEKGGLPVDPFEFLGIVPEAVADVSDPGTLHAH